MKALVYDQTEDKLELVDRPVPVCREGEALVQVILA